MAHHDLVGEPSSLISRQLSLLETGAYHEFILRYGERSFKVHRSIICPQSTVLRTLCNGDWKVRWSAQSVKLWTDAYLGKPDRRSDSNGARPGSCRTGTVLLYTGTYDNRIPSTSSHTAEEDAEPRKGKGPCCGHQILAIRANRHCRRQRRKGSLHSTS